MFFDDSPKTNPWTEDRLGYAPFAKRLMDAVLGIAAPEGYVIGLHGRWGSGKSTALNFLKAYFTKREQESSEKNVTLLEFKPWIISGHQDLISSFFKVLLEAVIDPEEKRGRIAKRRTLGLAKMATDPLVEAAAFVGIAADPSGGVVAKATAKATKAGLGKMIDGWLAEPSLQKSYEDLKEQVRKNGKKIVVIIDDIDRLDKFEIRLVMQMVKTVGRLPNVIYILSYDKNIVWPALEELSGSSVPSAQSHNYAEKIVQLELELPVPSRSSLLQVLNDEVEFAIGDISDDMRWYYALNAGVLRWIQIPRDVVRYANALKFAFPALADEVDKHDLFCIEGIRIFDKQLFEWIRSNRDFLVGDGRSHFFNPERKKEVVERLKGQLRAESVEEQLELLCMLFPNTAEHVGRRHLLSSGTTFEGSHILERRLSYAPAYDAYFSLFLSPDELPKGVVDEVLAVMAREDEVVSLFERYFDRSSPSGRRLIADLFEQLKYAIKRPGAPKPTQALVNAIFAVGERVQSIDLGPSILLLTPRAHLGFLLKECLLRLDVAAADAMIAEAFERCESAAFCADVWVDRGRELGILPDHRSYRDCPISRTAFEKLAPVVLSKIKAQMDNHTLDKAPLYFDIAHAWCYVEGDEPVRLWINESSLESGKFLSKLSIGLLAYSVDSRRRHYALRERPAESYYDLPVLLEAAIHHRGNTELNEDDAARLLALEKGIERLLHGSSEKGDYDVNGEQGP